LGSIQNIGGSGKVKAAKWAEGRVEAAKMGEV
jgi:hypothetical protein